MLGMSEQQLIKRLVPTIVRVRQMNFYQIVQRTVMLTFPFVLIGSFSQIIQVTILTKTGFIASIFHLSKWVPYYRYWHYPFDNLTNLTLNSVAIIAAFGAAKYHAKLHHRDDQLAGLTGAIALLLIAYRYTDQSHGIFTTALLGANGITGAILVGSVTGACFQWLGQPAPSAKVMTPPSILNRTLGAILPMVLVLGLAVGVSLILNWVFIVNYPEQLFGTVQKIATTSHSLWLTFSMAILTLLLEILGFAGPYQQRLMVNSPATTANLNYALSHHSAMHVPYPDTANTLYHAFGTFGGTGMLLALVIAIYLRSQQPHYRIVAKLGVLPALFNNNGPLMTGLPVLYNPVYLIPFVLAPVVNMGLAALVIGAKWLPPMVYPVPVGTPGPLVAFIGTNGNWVALALGLIDLCLSVLIYLPFMHLAEATIQAAEVEKRRSEVIDHEG
ncbi:PTS transporter subunit EIIC [Lactobacillus sp. CBA3605]|uniref:PTS transporter subunit EIIC n=1 Tax=Lactobacillus sp. CBA3605 TaxID=2099788 RepID=UPI001F2B5113|nr:PTS transporter subunit EIIC [Lactobacillus sp. CBA3605]